MKKIVLGSLLALGASTLLAGCGLIPPVALTNPLGLEGKTLAVALDATSAPVSTRTAGVGSASLTATFPDSASVPLAPSSIDISLALASATISPSCAAALNQTNIAVSLTNFTVELSDGTGATLRLFSAALPTVNFNVNPTNGTITNLAAGALNFVVSNVPQVTNILTSAPTPNTVKVNTTVTTTPALPGCTITFTFGAGGGNIKF